MDNITRRAFVKAGVKAGAMAALVAAVPSLAFAKAGKTLNDASGLSSTKIRKHIIVNRQSDQQLIALLRQELKTAAAEKRPVVASAARHSMGGQSLADDGTAITLGRANMELDEKAGTVRVSAGMRWHQLIAALDPKGFSPAVMQSNSDFGIASTFCVNAHGWPVPYGPFGSTVNAVRMMMYDGTILTCSPSENADLFSLAMGGYGLFGILLDLELKVVKNRLMKPTLAKLSSGMFAKHFVSEVLDPKVTMAYGRLDVTRDRFFESALAVSYRAQPTPDEGLPKVDDWSLMSYFSRKVYRAQIGSERAKRLRWTMETSVGPMLYSGIATRNTLMAEPVVNLAGDDASRTDILHEYFVPPHRLSQFITACQKIIPPSDLEFLNVTLRYVGADKQSVLAYAPEPRIALVMSFSQKRTQKGELEMRRVTRALIDAAYQAGGSYYLPYRLHATNKQLQEIYPRVREFAARKRHFDPGLLFRNNMWDHYFSDL